MPGRHHRNPQVDGHGCSRWNSRVTALDRCSLAEAILKQVISEMLQASAASAIRFIVTLTAWQ